MPDQNYVPMGPTPLFVEDEPIVEMTPSFGAYFTAASGNVIRDSPTSSLYRATELAGANAEFGGFDEFGVYRGGMQTERRTVSAEDAKALAEEAGVSVDFGTGRTTRAAVEIMIDRARRRAIRDMTISAYKPSLGTSLGISLVASLADPLNVASAFIPFVGQARYGVWLAEASGFGARSAIRAGVGAIEGVAGAALFEPLTALATTQEGRDYELADAVRNLLIGGVMGAGLHAGGGAVAEKLFKRTYASEPVQTPLDVVARLPEEAREVGLRTAIADLVEGRPVSAAEAIDLMARDNADIAAAISNASNLRRDGPVIDATEDRIRWWSDRLAPAATEKPVDFLAWVRQQGGVRDTTGEIRAAVGSGKLAPEIYVSQRGAARTERGVEIEDLFEKAMAEGYVADRAEFLAAFQPGGKPLLRASDAAGLKVRGEEKAHTERMLKEAGVNPRTRNDFKARAIVGREQSLLASERARYSAAQQRLENRLLPDPVEALEPLPPPSSDMEIQPSGQSQPASGPVDVKPKQPGDANLSKRQTETATLKAETDRRFAELTKWLPPESAAQVKERMTQLDAEVSEMNSILEVATMCVMGL